MMLLYQFVYTILFIPALPFYVLYRLLKKKPPVRVLSRLGLKMRKIPESENSPIWIHAVSVGEVLAAKPLIEILRDKYPYLPIVMSVTTDTGKEAAARELPYDIYIIDLPFDFGFAVRRYLSRVKPQIVMILETELWPRFCVETGNRNIPLILLNGRLSKTSFPRYKIVKSLMARVLESFTLLLVQTEEYRKRFLELGADEKKIHVVSSMKYHESNFDVDEELREQIRRRYDIDGTSPLFVAGSTHKGEEEIILRVYKKLIGEFADLRLAIVPRRPERFADVEKLISETGLAYNLRSEDSPRKDWKILLVDKMGELKIFYSLSKIVFIGGSLVPHGGQNMLEAAAYKVPVIFGKYIYNFEQMAEMFLKSGGGCSVADENALYIAARNFLDDKDKYKQAADAAHSIITGNQQGVTETCNYVEPFIKQRS